MTGTSLPDVDAVVLLSSRRGGARAKMLPLVAPVPTYVGTDGQVGGEGVGGWGKWGGGLQTGELCSTCSESLQSAQDWTGSGHSLKQFK